MALSEFELKRIEIAMEAFMVKHRPPIKVREKVDIKYRIDMQSVELFEVRPRWNSPQDMMESPIAKATFVKTQKLWKVYWMRSNLSWESYESTPTVKVIEGFLDLVSEDQHACFFG